MRRDTVKKIILMGKFNDTVKDINQYLAQYFTVQLCSENIEALIGMLDIVKPNLLLISLIGAYDIDATLFERLKKDYPDLPVTTIGTVNEMADYIDYYHDKQFDNLIRPIENKKIYEALIGRIGEQEDYKNLRSKLLIVDDNPALLRSVKGMLDEAYQVSIATSGMQALAAIGRNKPDIILLDYEMPVCDGKQTLEMIRGEEEMADIPVIFLTGVNDREHIEAVLKLKPAGYLLKPPIKEMLLKKIDEVLHPYEDPYAYFYK